jgi:hypothetical protein
MSCTSPSDTIYDSHDKIVSVRYESLPVVNTGIFLYIVSLARNKWHDVTIPRRRPSHRKVDCIRYGGYLLVVRVVVVFVGVVLLLLLLLLCCWYCYLVFPLRTNLWIHPSFLNSFYFFLYFVCCRSNTPLKPSTMLGHALVSLLEMELLWQVNDGLPLVY